MTQHRRRARHIKYVVNLSADERDSLRAMLRSGRPAARRAARARVLLKADEGLSDSEIASAVGIGIATVHRIRQRCVEEGLETALGERSRAGAPARLSGAQQAHLIALACSTPPDGRPRWTLRLLSDRLVELKLADRCSYETVRRVLKKTS